MIKRVILYRRAMKFRFAACLAALSVMATVAGVSQAREAPVESERPVALFDEGHGQRFYAEGDAALDLSKLADVFRDGGFEVRTANGRLTDESLRGIATLVVSGPFAPIIKEEVEAVRSFVERGGALCVMLHIPPPADELLRQFGVAISNGVVREIQGLIADEPLNFTVRHLAAHPVTQGLDGLSVYGAWALNNLQSDVSILATTGGHAWLDLDGDRRFGADDAMQPFGLVAAGTHGKGRFIAFGDDAMFQNRFIGEDNRKLAHNLVAWLLGAAAATEQAKGDSPDPYLQTSFAPGPS